MKKEIVEEKAMKKAAGNNEVLDLRNNNTLQEKEQ
jgi:hypothetical protein